MRISKTEPESRAVPATVSEAMPPSSYSTALPVRSKSRTQAAKLKSALTMLKMTNWKKTAQRWQSAQVFQVQMRAPPSINTLHEQV